MSLLFKHRLGDYGLTSILEFSAILGIASALSYNLAYPSTRSINGYGESFLFNVIIYFITIILSLIALKNISLGTGQDIFDETIITFMQLKGRKKLFFYIYFVDVLLLGISFILVTELIFYLGSFNFGVIWIFKFLDVYLLVCNLYLFVTLLIKKPFRSFLVNIFVAFVFIGFYIENIINYSIFALFLFILFISDYEIFQRLSV
ncbi:hypothetical protein B6F84_03925 [Acidianus manzaensis]|uniref:ABC transporter permease n=2 Tax=Acidianus manzaensis TaxID=282676 RepID=A0A1W6JY71_9CREN|nr:hypothetical protein B6F84_03925 [Acidianus manzaensis]